MTNPRTNIVIAGGGLAGTLTAAFLRRSHPECQLTIISAAEDPVAQTWSFHASDISEDAFNFIKPLLSKSWDGYSVRFPDHQRRLDLTYCTIRSFDYWQKIDAYLQGVRWLEKRVVDLNQCTVQLEDGSLITADAIIDARGLSREDFTVDCGWQKFLGFEIETKTPHGITEPVIMDAKVQQIDGYRFFYVLPYSETSLLVEDTRYSDMPFLNTGKVAMEIRDYLHSIGIKDYDITSEEAGALPIPLSQSYFDYRRCTRAIGMAGGLFHPTTGYSFPFAVRCAEQLAKNLGSLPEQATVNTIVDRFKDEIRGSVSFLIRLNRMLFRAGAPEKRWQILSKFYRHRTTIVKNFYSGQLNVVSILALLTGKPPVPLFAGIRHFISGRRPFKRPQEGTLHG